MAVEGQEKLKFVLAPLLLVQKERMTLHTFTMVFYSGPGEGRDDPHFIARPPASLNLLSQMFISSRVTSQTHPEKISYPLAHPVGT